MKEIWSDIPGLEGKYQVSNRGRYKRCRIYVHGRQLAEEILPLGKDMVYGIKEALSRGEHVYDIAERFGVSRKVVSKIKSGRSYAWVK